MKNSVPTLCALALVFTSACGESTDVFAPPERFSLVWSDEFDGNAGSPPNPDNWVFDLGIGPDMDGWGNNQLEFNTDQPTNVSLDGNGSLAITAVLQDFAGRRYTSGRIKTQGRFAQRYGRIEARIKLPVGQGMWPAFWMLGDDITQVGWPQTGEIDIMEYRGQDPNVVIGSVHGPGYSGGNAISQNFRREGDTGFDADFHVFAVEWDPSRISWWVDDQAYGFIGADSVNARGEWVFDDPFFILLNLAVGGSFVGDVGPDSIFPQAMLVDYVRVYQRTPVTLPPGGAAQ